MQKDTKILICMVFILVQQCSAALEPNQEIPQNIFSTPFPKGIDKLKEKIDNIPLKDLLKMLFLLKAVKYLDNVRGYNFSEFTPFSTKEAQFRYVGDVSSNRYAGHQLGKQYSNENISKMIYLMQKELGRRGNQLSFNSLISNQSLNDDLEIDFQFGKNSHQNLNTSTDEENMLNHSSIQHKEEIKIKPYRYMFYY